ncbi:MAG: quinone-dependent dihydroorotate dehydrogenase [Paracoccaceae bacterium]|nr:quinone-dependent dihydroorotate dehydrogenase [Paracoccaceae bacterium]
MRLREKIGLKALQKLNPETAHWLAIKAMQLGLAPKITPPTSPRLRTRIGSLELPNPVGLAAGFDKNAQALSGLLGSGFGFIEVGAATPLPQPGNPKPRLFRLTEDSAAINRFGFNNDGMEQIAARLKNRPQKGFIGLNLGANKTSPDRAADFAKVLSFCGEHIDFATVNVSSPNTEKLRDLQGKAALSALLAGVNAARDALEQPIPVFLKIAPDLNAEELADVAEVAAAQNIAAVIATNTTLSRDGLHSPHRGEAGGLSGAPLFEKSTRVLAQLSQLMGPNVPLIGVGGVRSGADAYAKIRAGASAVQLYTGLVFGGVSLAAKIATDLDQLLEKDGFDSLEKAIGSNREAWL